MGSARSRAATGSETLNFLMLPSSCPSNQQPSAGIANVAFLIAQHRSSAIQRHWGQESSKDIQRLSSIVGELWALPFKLLPTSISHRGHRLSWDAMPRSPRKSMGNCTGRLALNVPCCFRRAAERRRKPIQSLAGSLPLPCLRGPQ